MRDPIPVGIVGLGVALPPEVRENSFWDDKLASRSETQRRGDILAVERRAEGGVTELSSSITSSMSGLDDLYRGAVKRHVLAADVELADLEAEAVRGALTDSRTTPSDVDLLMVHSLPNDFATPFNAPRVQQRAALARATAWNVEVGCGSLQAQLVAAAGLLSSGLFRRSVIVQSAAMSRIVDFTAPMSIGFGDAAVAAVVGTVPSGYGLLGHASHTDGSLFDGVVMAPVESGLPQREWYRGKGHVVLTSLDTDMGKSMGIEGPAFCRRTCLDALADAQMSVDDVDWFICNQSVGWFVEACRKELGIGRSKTIDTFPEVANIGAAAILYNLAELKKRELLRDGQKILMYSPSAGFTRAAVVVRWFDARSG